FVDNVPHERGVRFVPMYPPNTVSPATPGLRLRKHTRYGPRPPGERPMLACHPEAGRMERPRVYGLGPQPGEPVPQLGGGLTRMRDGQGAAGVDLPAVNRVSNPMGNGAGLAGSGPGDDAHRAADGRRRRPLLRVEAV